MRLRVTAGAADDLEGIRDRLAAFDASIAEDVLGRIARVIETLLQWPRLGHAGRRAGTCEIVVPRLPFLIVYRIDLGTSDELVVLRVFHARRQRC